MIKISMKNNIWRINIDNEEWEFEDINKLKEIIENILVFKDDYGRIQ